MNNKKRNEEFNKFIDDYFDDRLKGGEVDELTQDDIKNIVKKYKELGKEMNDDI